MADDKILDKIRKCLALTSSANEHEAAAALRQAQILMKRHGISDQDVLASKASEAAARSGAVNSPPCWEALLCGRIATAFGCTSLHSRSNSTVAVWKFIGTGAAPEIASYAFKVLFRQAKKARADYIKSHLKRVRRPSVKTARADLFCQGWVRTAISTVVSWTRSPEQAEAVQAYIASHFPNLEELATKDRAPANLRDHHVNDLKNGLNAGLDAVLNRGVGADAAPAALEG